MSQTVNILRFLLYFMIRPCTIVLHLAVWARRYLGILVIHGIGIRRCMHYLNFREQYYRTWRYRGFAVSRNSFKAREFAKATLLKTKAWYLQTKSTKKI